MWIVRRRIIQDHSRALSATHCPKFVYKMQTAFALIQFCRPAFPFSVQFRFNLCMTKLLHGVLIQFSIGQHHSCARLYMFLFTTLAGEPPAVLGLVNGCQ